MADSLMEAYAARRAAHVGLLKTVLSARNSAPEQAEMTFVRREAPSPARNDQAALTSHDTARSFDEVLEKLSALVVQATAEKNGASEGQKAGGGGGKKKRKP